MIFPKSDFIFTIAKQSLRAWYTIGCLVVARVLGWGLPALVPSTLMVTAQAVLMILYFSILETGDAHSVFNAQIQVIFRQDSVIG